VPPIGGRPPRLRRCGPGLFFLLPVVDQITQIVDQRVRVTDVSAESALTRDTVPVNVDAIVFWTVWDTPTPRPLPTPTPTPFPPCSALFVGPCPIQPTPTPTPIVPPAIPYKALGLFGPREAPIVSLEEGTRIINASEGDTIDGKFIIRKINRESVDFAFTGLPPEITRRIPVPLP
jgi:hypothetical protein